MAALLLLGCSGASAPAAGPAAPLRAGAGELREMASEILAASERVYVSDYLSFVGSDERGRVAFALDNNRGRDGEAYQAEHFLVLHDEQRGWIDLPGRGAYPNPTEALLEIPDSPFFAFEGSPAAGLTIRGLRAPLELEIAPLEASVIRGLRGRAILAMASAGATLRWKGRTLPGRVIHETLVLEDRNRLSRVDWSLLFSSTSFQGLYLATPEGGDLYVHRAKGGFAALGGVLGLEQRQGRTREPQDLVLEVVDTSQGPGFFRWPTAWRARWNDPDLGPARLHVRTVDFRRITNLIFGGFAMGIVTGEIERGDDRIPVYGFSEIIEWWD